MLYQKRTWIWDMLLSREWNNNGNISCLMSCSDDFSRMTGILSRRTTDACILLGFVKTGLKYFNYGHIYGNMYHLITLNIYRVYVILSKTHTLAQVVWSMCIHSDCTHLQETTLVQGPQPKLLDFEVLVRELATCIGTTVSEDLKKWRKMH